MNATEDGEPLGESPAIDTLTAIGRGAVAGMLAGADYAKAITAMQEVLDLAVIVRDLARQLDQQGEK